MLWVKGKDPVPRGDADTIRRFFQHPWIIPRELRPNGRRTRARSRLGPRRQTKDAVHVATALDAAVEQLDTFDAHLIGLSEKIGNPPLKIGPPGIEGMLFAPEVDA